MNTPYHENEDFAPRYGAYRNGDGVSRVKVPLRTSSPLSFEPKLNVKEKFAKLDSASKCLLQAAMEKISRLRQHSKSTADRGKRLRSSSPKGSNSSLSNNGDEFSADDEELAVRELFEDLRENLAKMKSLSHDMSAVQTNSNLNPRVLDQIKTYELSVDGLHSSIRKLQLDFQQIMNTKRRQDLLSLSKSPFDDENSLANMRSRRGNGAGSVSTNTTNTLLKSRNILLETVERSTGTLEQLAQSSLTIVNSQEDLKEQNTIVSTSRKLLSKYGRREWTDRMLICLGLLFFFAVVAYIIQKRLL
jgi:protein transport protein SEC20